MWCVREFPNIGFTSAFTTICIIVHVIVFVNVFIGLLDCALFCYGELYVLDLQREFNKYAIFKGGGYPRKTGCETYS